jgi:2-methylfumaryl-CoA isomerase
VSQPLSGVRVIEVSSFVAAPAAGLTPRQLGADVVRIDPLGGAADVRRWPLAASGDSLYWSGLNRGKRSVELDLSSEGGRDAVHRLLEAGGPNGGILVSNVFGREWLADDTLRTHRADLIHVQVLGWADGSPAVDYVVNAATGLPYATGPDDATPPVNHVLPAWDLLCGMHAAVAVLAGLQRRERTGEGSHVTVSLEDVAVSTLASLGMLSEAHQTGISRPRVGNAVYGMFGMDAVLVDGTVVMVTAVTKRQWEQLLDVTGCTDAVAAAERAVGADFGDEGDRFRHRDVLVGLLRPWFATRSLGEVTAALAKTAVLWSPFRQLTDLAAEVAAGRSAVASLEVDARLGDNIVTSGPLRFRGEESPPVLPAPVLGADSASVLSGDC